MTPTCPRPRFVALILAFGLLACTPAEDIPDGGGGGGDVGGDVGDVDTIDTSSYSGRIAYVSQPGNALWVRDLASNQSLYIAESEGDFPNLVTLQDPVLSPDASVLVYWRLGSIDGVLAGSAGEVVSVDLASGEETRIPRDLGDDDVRLSYIPWANNDGSLVAYREVIVEGYSDPLTSTSTAGIGLWDGTTATTLFTSETLTPVKLLLTADASEILFSVDDGNNNFELYRLPVAGGDPTLVELASHPDLDSLVLDGYGWDASDDGSVIAFAGGIVDGAVGEGRVGAFVQRDGVVTRIGEVTGILRVDLSGDGGSLTMYGLDEATTASRLYVSDTVAPAPTVVIEAVAGTRLTFGALNQDGSALAYGDGTLGNDQLQIARADGSERTLVQAAEIDDRFLHSGFHLDLSLR